MLTPVLLNVSLRKLRAGNAGLFLCKDSDEKLKTFRVFLSNIRKLKPFSTCDFPTPVLGTFQPDF